MPSANVIAVAGHRDRVAHRAGGSGELRQGNLTQILCYLRDHGASSRQDVARGCGLGVSTMTDLVGDLRARRLVVELDPIRRPGAGRPTRPIALDGAPWCVLGVQVQPCQVNLVAATVGGEELLRETVWTELVGADRVPALVEVIRTQLERLPADRRLVAMEIGVPGHVLPDGTVASSRVLDWSDVALGETVRSMLAGVGLGGVHVGVSTDSHLAGLHAARTLLGDPAHAVAAYLSGVRDIDSAVVVDGEVLRGRGGGAGDLAHLHVQADGPECWCGRRGCLNAVVRIEHLLSRSDLMSADEAERLVREQPAKAVVVLAEAAAAGESTVLEALSAAGDALGLAIDDVVGLVNPGAVILGGYLGQLAPYLVPALEARLGTRLSAAPYAETRILALGDGTPQVAAGGVIAARDACLYHPLGLTEPLS